MSSHLQDTTVQPPDRWSNEVVPRLPANLDAEAKRLGALQRKRAFASAHLLLRSLLAYALCASSLAQLGAWGVLSDTVDITASSWLKRLRAATPWLTWLLNQLLDAPPAPWLAAFGQWRAKVIDISSFGLRGGTGDDLRLHLSYDLLSGQFSHLNLTDRSHGEDLSAMQLQPRDIAIVDAGYGFRRHIAAVVKQLAAIVVRIYLPSCPLHDANGRPLDVVRQLERRGRVPLETRAIVQHESERIAVRVIAVPLPADQCYHAQQRLRKTARRKGRKASPTGLMLAGWLVLVTTLPAEAWLASAVVQLYRARWQVEIVFKRFKQLLGLQQLRCTTTTSGEALLRSILIGWMLSSKLVAEVRPALQAAAAPAPDTLPGEWGEAEAVVSMWSVQRLSLDLLRQQIWGQWTLERLRAVLPRLERHLVKHPRAGRYENQETQIRARLSGQRLTRPRPLLEAA
jgi:hypothetical protein